MNMINVRRLTVIAFLGAGMLPGISAQNSSLQVDTLNETKLPAQWDLQSCIDYALEQNITIRKNRVTAASTQIDVKTAKAALFPSLSFSTSQQVVTGRIRNQVAESVAVRLSVPTVKPVTMETTD